MNAGRSKGGVVKALKRRTVVVVAPALCAMMLAAAVSLSLPRIYLAETRIELAGAGGLAGAEYAGRVAAVTEQILCHEAFSQSATKLGLDAEFAKLPDAERSEKREAMLASFKEHASVSVKPSGEVLTIATISSRGDDPDLATRIVGALADEAQGLAGNPAMAVKEKAVVDLTNAAKSAKESCEHAAKEHQDYRDEHREFLDGATQKLQATREQKKQLRDVTIAGLEQKKKELEDMLAQEKQFEVVTVKQPDAVRLAGVDERLAAAREKLRQLTAVDKKADNDPDVGNQRKRIADIEEERRKVIAEASPAESRQQNEQWLQLMKAKAEAQSRLDAANRQFRLICETEKEQEELARRTPEFEAKVKTLEAAEAAARAIYDAKSVEIAKAEADLAAERARGTLQIHTMDAPEKPRNPSGPGALVLAAAGLALGAIAGIVTALALNAADHSFRETEAVSGFLGIATMAAIRVIETPAEAAQRRRKRRRGGMLLAGLAVLACLVLTLAMFGNAHAIADFVKSVVG